MCWKEIQKEKKRRPPRQMGDMRRIGGGITAAGGFGHPDKGE